MPNFCSVLFRFYDGKMSNYSLPPHRTGSPRLFPTCFWTLSRSATTSNSGLTCAPREEQNIDQQRGIWIHRSEFKMYNLEVFWRSWVRTLTWDLMMSCHLWRRLTPKNWGCSRLPLAPGKVKAVSTGQPWDQCVHTDLRDESRFSRYIHTMTHDPNDWPVRVYVLVQLLGQLQDILDQAPSAPPPKVVAETWWAIERARSIAHSSGRISANQAFGWDIGFFCGVDSVAECHSHGPHAVTETRKNNVQHYILYIIV